MVFSDPNSSNRNRIKPGVRTRPRQFNQREADDAMASLASYLEEEKQKIRREFSQQIIQRVHPLLSKIDKQNGSVSPDILGVIRKKLEELTSLAAAQNTVTMRRTFSQLSPAEWRVCQMLRQGQRTKEIAESLNLSPATVENQRNAIRRKLGLPHATNLVTFLQQV